MRQPIFVSHDKKQYQVIFRKRGGIKNWNIYVDAELPEDAAEAAKNLIAADWLKYPDEIGDWKDWKIVEIYEAESADNCKLVRSYS